MTDVHSRIEKAIERYHQSKGHWLTIGGGFGEHGEKHVGGTHVEVDDSGKITAGPAAFAGKSLSNLSSKKPKPDTGHPVPPKNEGESEKQWLKRIASQMPAPAELPEEHDAYFNLDKAHAVVPMDQLRSTKTDEENQKGGNNAPKFMDLSRRGFTGKRDPITVRKNDQGGYDVVDGNGTFTGAKAHGWKEMPVQIEGHATESPMHPGEGHPPLPDEKPKEIPHGKPFFTPEELGNKEQALHTNVEHNSGYKAVYEHAKVADRQLHGMMSNVASGMGAQVYDAGQLSKKQFEERCAQPGPFISMGPIKLEDKSTGKVKTDYADKNYPEGDWRKLRDIVRCTAVVDSLDDVHKVLDLARKAGIKFARKPKDNIAHPLDGTNYRDINCNIMLPNGTVGELQINTKPMIVAKNGEGHKLYDIIEKLPKRAKLEKRGLTYEEKSQIAYAKSKSRELYDAAWEKLQKGEAAKTHYARRVANAREQYAKKRYADAKGQRDLFTGEKRVSEKTQQRLRWITLHNSSGEPTTHVQIGDDGKIHSGPAALKGRNLSEFGGALKEKPKEPKGSRNPDLQTTEDGRPVGHTVMSIDDLHVDPERFQYKTSDIDKETGTNGELKKVKEFNPMLGGQLLVWHDPKDGMSYVVNGHHRAELAKRSPRSNEIGKFNGRMPVYYVDAKTHQEARAHGALANIAEGRGTATDAARFMRDRGVGLEDFSKVGVSPSGAVAQAALELKKLSPNLFQKLSNGMISEGRAQAIGKHLESHDAQNQLHQWIQKHEKEKTPYSDRKVAEMAKATASTKPKKEGCGGMFEDWFDKFPIEERADIADHISRTLGGELKSLKDASSDKRAGVLEQEGENKIDTTTNRSRAQRAAIAEDEFQKRANAQGHPIAQALDMFAERLSSEPPKKRNAILKEALARIRQLIHGQGPDVGRVEESNSQPLPEDDRRQSNREQSVSGAAVSKFSRIERASNNFQYYLEKLARN